MGLEAERKEHRDLGIRHEGLTPIDLGGRRNARVHEPRAHHNGDESDQQYQTSSQCPPQT